MDNLYDVMFARGLKGGGGGGFTPTQSQLDAMNSGITEELVTQIGTNETNILSVSQRINIDFVNGEQVDLTSVEWEQKIPDASTGVPKASETRICTKKITLPTGTRSVQISFDDTTYKVAFYTYDGDTCIRKLYWFSTSPFTTVLQKNEKEVIVGVSYANNSDIDTTKSTAVTKIHFEIDTSEIGIKANNSALNFVIGSLSPDTGEEITSTTRIRSNYIFLPKDSKVVGYKAIGQNLSSIIVYEFNADMSYRRSSSWNNPSEYTVTDDAYCRILIRKAGDATISDSDIPAMLENVAIFPAYPVKLFNDIFNKSYIPAYYNIDAKKSTIKDNQQSVGVDGFTFAFITDLHWESNVKNVSIISAMHDNTDINYLICGGDIINGGGKSKMVDTMADCMNKLYNTGFDTLCVYGNHDNNSIPSGNTLISAAEYYTICQSKMPNGVVYGDYCYFYYDDTKSKTRIICLDSGAEGTTLSTAQGNFIDAALQSTPEGWHIIVVFHIIYQPDTGTTWSTVPLDLVPTAFATAVFTKLDSHNSGGTSKVEAIIGGHVHSDWNFVTTGGIPIILTDTASLNPLSGGTATRGTVSETALDVITIDYTNSVVKCVRIGRGSDRTISYS